MPDKPIGPEKQPDGLQRRGATAVTDKVVSESHGVPPRPADDQTVPQLQVTAEAAPLSNLELHAVQLQLRLVEEELAKDPANQARLGPQLDAVWKALDHATHDGSSIRRELKEWNRLTHLPVRHSIYHFTSSGNLGISLTEVLPDARDPAFTPANRDSWEQLIGQATRGDITGIGRDVDTVIVSTVEQINARLEALVRLGQPVNLQTVEQLLRGEEFNKIQSTNALRASRAWLSATYLIVGTASPNVGAQLYSGLQAKHSAGELRNTSYEDFMAQFDNEMADYAAQHLHGGKTRPDAHSFGSRTATAQTPALLPNREGVIAKLHMVVDETGTTVAEQLTDMYGRIADAHPDHKARDLRKLGEVLRRHGLETTSDIGAALGEEARTPTSRFYGLLDAMERAAKGGR
jgi:hypothetical protein